jgi:hypothetical protein
MKDEKLLYRQNKFSGNLLMIYLLLNTYYTVYVLNKIPMNYYVGIFIMINIFLSLFVFLLSSKLKVYSMPWSITSAILSILLVFRYFVDRKIVLPQIGRPMNIRIVMILSVILPILASIIGLIRAFKYKEAEKARMERFIEIHGHISGVR